jgi:hypothetical protein
MCTLTFLYVLMWKTHSCSLSKYFKCTVYNFSPASVPSWITCSSFCIVQKSVKYLKKAAYYSKQFILYSLNVLLLLSSPPLIALSYPLRRPHDPTDPSLVLVKPHLTHLLSFYRTDNDSQPCIKVCLYLGTIAATIRFVSHCQFRSCY